VQRIVYVGDPTGAAAFRLAGIETSVPDAGAEPAAVEAALVDAELVMVAASVADTLPVARRTELEAALTPLFVVLPDTRDTGLPDDRLGGVLGQLGVES
jgi:vacuolar-type H+-ATPase subunit F/Vma7